MSKKNTERPASDAKLARNAAISSGPPRATRMGVQGKTRKVGAT
jgi:hypothetical protein